MQVVESWSSWHATSVGLSKTAVREAATTLTSGRVQSPRCLIAVSPSSPRKDCSVYISGLSPSSRPRDKMVLAFCVRRLAFLILYRSGFSSCTDLGCHPLTDLDISFVACPSSRLLLAPSLSAFPCTNAESPPRMQDRFPSSPAFCLGFVRIRPLAPSADPGTLTNRYSYSAGSGLRWHYKYLPTTTSAVLFLDNRAVSLRGT